MAELSLPDPFPSIAVCDTPQRLLSSAIVPEVVGHVDRFLTEEGHGMPSLPWDERISCIFRTLGESPNSLASRDTAILAPYQSEKDGTFRDRKFYDNILPGLLPRLSCLRWEDYEQIRKLRLRLEKACAKNPELRKKINDYIRRVAWVAMKQNDAIKPNRLEQFFPGIRTGEIDYASFFGELEKAMLDHIMRNPLYQCVPWSHENIPQPSSEEHEKLIRFLEQSGFALIQDFGHAPDAATKKTTLYANDDVQGAGVFPHEQIYTPVAPWATPSKAQSALVQGGWMYLVEICQKLLLDARIARIRRKDSQGRILWDDPIVDEVILARIDPKHGAEPLLAYSLGKLWATGTQDADNEKTFDAKHFPSYQRLVEQVPERGTSKSFAIIDAKGPEIDFGICYHAPDGEMYIVAFNDTDRTLLQIVKILKATLFTQTMGATSQISLSMMQKLLGALHRVLTD